MSSTGVVVATAGAARGRPCGGQAVGGRQRRQPDLPIRDHGPGMFLCRIGDDIFVKNAFGPAKQLGIAPGMQVLTIEGEPALRFLETRTEQLRDLGDEVSTVTEPVLTLST